MKVQDNALGLKAGDYIKFHCLQAARRIDNGLTYYISLGKPYEVTETTTNYFYIGKNLSEYNHLVIRGADGIEAKGNFRSDSYQKIISLEQIIRSINIEING